MTIPGVLSPSGPLQVSLPVTRRYESGHSADVLGSLRAEDACPPKPLPQRQRPPLPTTWINAVPSGCTRQRVGLSVQNGLLGVGWSRKAKPEPTTPASLPQAGSALGVRTAGPGRAASRAAAVLAKSPERSRQGPEAPDPARGAGLIRSGSRRQDGWSVLYLSPLPCID